MFGYFVLTLYPKFQMPLTPPPPCLKNMNLLCTMGEELFKSYGIMWIAGINTHENQSSKEKLLECKAEAVISFELKGQLCKQTNDVHGALGSWAIMGDWLLTGHSL